MKEQLEKSIRTVEDMQLVERLIAAKDTAERVKICEEAEKTPEFQAFKKLYAEAYWKQPACVKYMISADEFFHTKQNVVAIAIIFIILEIDDIYLFGVPGYKTFVKALIAVEGVQGELAKKVANMLVDDAGIVLTSEYALEELLEKFF